jgi:hypothetical protein
MFSRMTRGFNAFRGMAKGWALRGGTAATEAAFRFGGTRAGMKVGGAMTSAAIWGARNPRAMTGIAAGGMMAGGYGAGRLMGFGGNRGGGRDSYGNYQTNPRMM